jgi:pimeloyl-ACP methyl ester carboxylesterase
MRDDDEAARAYTGTWCAHGARIHGRHRVADGGGRPRRLCAARDRRPGVSRAIFGNLPSLIAARKRYRGVKAPVTLVYGDSDWSRPSDRQANLALVPGARSVTLRHTGHFAALESPGEVARVLLGDDR